VTQRLHRGVIPRPAEAATRRGVLAGAGLTGLAGAVSACGLLGGANGDNTGDGAPAATTAAPGTPPASAGTAGGTSAGGAGAGGAGAGGAGAGGAGAAAGALGATSEIPVGGGKVFASAKVVVTQPAAGQFKGFSAICTHQQCTVDQVSDGTIDCPCHGSQFSVKDGSVISGPASSPLPAAAIKVSGTSIELG
jgi:Rieske Fe-S protein